MTDILVPYKPFDKQKLFHASQAIELLYGGAAGGGKSRALRWEAFIRCNEIPDYRAIIFRRNFPDLEKSQILESKKEFPPGTCIYKENKKRWEFPNNSMLFFSHLDGDNAVYDHKSAEYEYIGFDEATEFTQFQYTYLLSRLRTNKPGVVPVMRGATNPGGIGHNFFKIRFIDPALPYEVWKPKVGGTRQFIPATLWDNPHINHQDYVNNLMSLPEDQRRALLNGDWSVVEGQSFKEFDSSVHVIRPFKIPVHWPKYMGADWGFSKPFAFLWGAVAQEKYTLDDTRIIPKGSIIIYREYYGCVKGEADVGIERSAREVAWDILNKENEVVHVRVIDPSTWSRRGHDGPTIAEIFIEEGIYFNRADNNRLAGKMQVHDRLRVNEKTGEPSLFIFDTCYHLHRTLPALPADPRNPEDVDTKAEDHLYDGLKYLLMARPMVRKLRTNRPKQEIDPYTGY